MEFEAPGSAGMQSEPTDSSANAGVGIEVAVARRANSKRVVDLQDMRTKYLQLLCYKDSAFYYNVNGSRADFLHFRKTDRIGTPHL